MPSTRSFTPTRQVNPCLICGDNKGNCRQTPEDLHLCVSASGTISGFRYLGQTKDGLCAKYVIDDGQEQSQDDRESSAQRFRHYHQKQQLRQQRAAAEAQRHADALPAMERESFAPRVRHYRQLLSQLPLHPADRADLHHRGLTDEQIETWGVRSVEQWQWLERELPHELAGVSLDGRSQVTFQNVIRAVGSHKNIQFNVSQIPLKRLTRADNQGLIDATKEVMSDKWFNRRKKTPTGKKEF
jgi:hypothetical protein